LPGISLDIVAYVARSAGPGQLAEYRDAGQRRS